MCDRKISSVIHQNGMEKRILLISDFGIHDGINCRIYDFIRSSFAVICQMKMKGSARCRTLSLYVNSLYYPPTAY